MCNENEQKQKNTSKVLKCSFFSKGRLNLFFAYLDNNIIQKYIELLGNRATITMKIENGYFIIKPCSVCFLINISYRF